MAILADVAPYSREYNTYRQKVGRQAQGNTELEIEYEKILTRVKKTRESVIRMKDRHFTEPVDEIAGTVESASPGESPSRVGVSVLPDTQHLARPRFWKIPCRRRIFVAAGLPAAPVYNPGRANSHFGTDRENNTGIGIDPPG